MKVSVIFCICLLILLFVGIMGCTDPEGEDKPIFKKEIIGTWFNQGEMDNETYAIVYEFYENMSFYSALIDFNKSVAINAIRGTYDMDNTTIYFSETNMPVAPELDYVFEDDYLNLLLYYPDAENPIVFSRDLESE